MLVFFSHIGRASGFEGLFSSSVQPVDCHACLILCLLLLPSFFTMMPPPMCRALFGPFRLTKIPNQRLGSKFNLQFRDETALLFCFVNLTSTIPTAVRQSVSPYIISSFSSKRRQCHYSNGFQRRVYFFYPRDHSPHAALHGSPRRNHPRLTDFTFSFPL